MNVKTLIFDLDRTLLRTDKTLSPYTVAVLKECRNRGFRIMIATARPQRAITQFCEMIDFDAMTVSNGARILFGGHREEYGLHPESAERLLKALKRYPEFRVTLETGDCAYSNKPIEDYETTLCDDLVSRAKSEGTLKILVHLDAKDALPIVAQELSDDLYYTIASGHLMQIMSKAATKWNGISEMLKACGCSAKSSAYFGDDFDDIEPLKMCGTGIAVANGISEAKAAADYIAESNDEDGVASFIQRMLLN